MFVAVDGAKVTLRELTTARRELDAQKAVWLARIAEYDATEQWRADGYSSTHDALKIECRMTEGAARSHVELARKYAGDGFRGDDDVRRARRRWTVHTTPDGMGAGDYLADPESNEIIRTALKAELARDRRPNETRAAEQRRFDAAVNIFRRSLDNGRRGSTNDRRRRRKPRS